MIIMPNYRFIIMNECLSRLLLCSKRISVDLTAEQTQGLTSRRDVISRWSPGTGNRAVSGVSVRFLAFSDWFFVFESERETGTAETASVPVRFCEPWNRAVFTWHRDQRRIVYLTWLLELQLCFYLSYNICFIWRTDRGGSLFCR